MALNGKGWYIYIWNILRPFGTFYGHLVIKWQFGIFSPVLVNCVKKKLATLDIAWLELILTYFKIILNLWQKSPFFNLPLMAICKSQFI
jgi:hypothetical protein